MNAVPAKAIVHLEIDGQPLEAEKGEMVIQVADRAGIYIPRFCYHPHLTIAANCRMCLVEVEKAPKPLPACATPVTEGMRVSTRSPRALSAQHATMEFLLINHPLDCPVCDQGGECELQDLAMGYGFDHSRFQESKRVVADENIGPLVSTDMTRCIYCSRCVRFGQEIAGDPELAITGRGEHTEVRSFLGRELESELSGNIIDLCPVGALNSKPFRFAARTWEMLALPGISAHDAMGSHLWGHTLRGRLMRVVPRAAPDRNGIWLSDRDRFGYAGLYTDDRIISPKIRTTDGTLAPAEWEVALDAFADRLKRVVAEAGPEAVGALYSPQCTLEEMYLFEKILKELGVEGVDSRLFRADARPSADDLAEHETLGLSLAEFEAQEGFLLIGTDLRNEYPLLNLRVRRASLHGAQVAVFNPVRFDANYATVFNEPLGPEGMIGGLARLLGAIASNEPEPLPAWVQDWATQAPIGADDLGVLVKFLERGPRVQIILGEWVEAHPLGSVLTRLVSEIARRTGARWVRLPSGPNALGAARIGALRGAGAPRVIARELFDQPRKLYCLLGVEPEYDLWDPVTAMRALGAAEEVLVLASWLAPSHATCASIVLPLAAQVETGGTYIDLEGRMNGFEALVPPLGEARPGWKILRVLGQRMGLRGFEYESRDAILAEIAAHAPLAETKGPDSPPEAVQGPDRARQGWYRIARRAPYGGDPCVRHSAPLQSTGLARRARTLYMHPADAKEQGVGAGSFARPRPVQNASTVPVAFHDGIPRGVVWLDAATEAAWGWGASWGPLDLVFSSTADSTGGHT
ncbi:MAG: NADH-quinone oxidoreductase subunit NuoG [Gammaproteobacteria bacterium]